MPTDGFSGQKVLSPMNPEAEPTVAGHLVRSVIETVPLVALSVALIAAERLTSGVSQTRTRLKSFGESMRHFAQEIGDGSEESNPVASSDKVQVLPSLHIAEQPISYQRRQK